MGLSAVGTYRQKEICGILKHQHFLRKIPIMIIKFCKGIDRVMDSGFHDNKSMLYFDLTFPSELSN